MGITWLEVITDDGLRETTGEDCIMLQNKRKWRRIGVNLSEKKHWIEIRREPGEKQRNTSKHEAR
jgi:hypothetical protein